MSSSFNPNDVGIKNNHFIGLPFDLESANIVLFPVPWDVTVSYGAGTSAGPKHMLNASYQLDLADRDIPNAWKSGIYMATVSDEWSKKNQQLRAKAANYIEFLESGQEVSGHLEMEAIQKEVNRGCLELKNWVYNQTKAYIQRGKLVGLVGGDHSTPFGYIQALTEQYASFSILQIDAHMDLRRAYEGFEYSHASIFWNVLQMPNIDKLVQIGIRDYCQEELLMANKDPRIKVYFDQYIHESLASGVTLINLIDAIIHQLSQNVYISFDIDGLDPNLCPGTGTPVPGGLSFNDSILLIKRIVQSGRKIIGFDLCEVAGNEKDEWDGNVGARLLYKMSNWMAVSQGIL